MNLSSLLTVGGGADDSTYSNFKKIVPTGTGFDYRRFFLFRIFRRLDL